MPNTSPDRYRKIAPFYDFLAAIFSFDQIFRSQVCLLDSLPNEFGRALVVGGGTGRFLEELNQKKNIKEIVNLDSSSQMIAYSRKRLGANQENITHLCEDIFCVKDLGSFDLICTHYVLDVFNDEDITVVMNLLDSCLHDEGYWLFSDFEIPSKGLNRVASIGITKMLYWFFFIATDLKTKKIPPVLDEFKKMRYTPVLEKYFISRIIHSAIMKKGLPQANPPYTVNYINL
jgi:ubiquinone/menaquinone biosynthesis C-methylase UbiE